MTLDMATGAAPKGRVKIRVFSKERGSVVTFDIEKLLSHFQFVEELVNYLLDSVSISSVFRNLFAIRLHDNPPLWLAPNTHIKELCSTKLNQTPKELIYELRMRFRPSCSHGLKSMSHFDQAALSLVFNQIRYDFLYTTFDYDKNENLVAKIWIMIALELARQALEKQISVERFLELNPNRAIKTPKIMNILDKGLTKAQTWIRKSRLTKSASLCARKLGDRLEYVMVTYIETFLTEVCTSYASECYRVECLDVMYSNMTLDLRVRYVELDKQVSCIIETKPLADDSRWAYLCDMQSIGYGTYHSGVVELDRSNGSPFRAKFDRNWDAKSFLSLIGGYYRLMRKWNFNFCQTVASPDLNFLTANKIHGPIGLESAHKKLPLTKSPGTFIVRRCMEQHNHYIIDLITKMSTRLEIELVHDSCLNVFTLHTSSSPRGSTTTRSSDSLFLLDQLSTFTDQDDENGHRDDNHDNDEIDNEDDSPVIQEIITKDATYKVSLNYRNYENLKSLISDVQVWILDGPGGTCLRPPMQLKYWISSGEYDDYLFLMASISKSYFRELELNQESVQHSITNLPKIIPQKMIDQPKEVKNSGNMMLVKFTSLQQQMEVIIKDYDAAAVLNPNQAIFCSSYQRDTKLLNNYISAPQLKIAEWIFLKCPVIASTLGVSLGTSSLIQEHFDLGSLNDYLKESRVITGELIKAVSRQVLEALLYLQERQIIHGKIRLHNIFITQLEPLMVKITDPLGAIDVSKDRAFLPPEFTSLKGKIYVDEYSIGLDIWAFGTTLWQMYNRASYPEPDKYANTLAQPKSCPDTIWGPLESCWHPDPSHRASPHSVFRDLNDSRVWLNFHDYECVSRCGDLEESDAISRKDSGSDGKLGDFTWSPHLQLGDQIQEPLGDYVSKLPGYCPPKKKGMGWIRSLGRSSSDSSCLNETFINSRKCDSKTAQQIKHEKELQVVGLEVAIEGACSEESWIINQRKLKLGQELGRGFYGVVRKAFLRSNAQDIVVAVKCISGATCDKDTTEDLKREFMILKNLNHPNIVKTLGFVEDAKVMLVVEYMPFGSLLTYIKNRPHNVFVNMPLKKYCIDIAKGMEYLESMKIVHRDLALRNILLSSLEEAKICDFGLAHFLGQSNHYEMKTSRALPLRWYAPETLESQIFSHKSDVWSYGVVVWEIYSGGCSPQYSSQNLVEILKTERLPKPEDCPQDIYDIMNSCWDYDPKNRDSFTMLVSKLE